MDQTLAETDTINLDIRKILDTTTAEWGVEVTLVELKDIQLPDSMKRAMARQAEAEREKRAKIINAEDEYLAAAALGEASDTMMAHPLALQLRNLQSLVEIGVDGQLARPEPCRHTARRRASLPWRDLRHPNPPRPRSRPCRETPSRAEGPPLLLTCGSRHPIATRLKRGISSIAGVCNRSARASPGCAVRERKGAGGLR